MDLERLRKLAGIISESADVTAKIKDGKVTTDDKGEAITNQIVQGKGGDIQVSDEAKPEDKPTVPKDVKAKGMKLKEAFDAVMDRPRAAVTPTPGGMQAMQAPVSTQTGYAADTPMAQAFAAYNNWKKQCKMKDPRCTFTGVKDGTEATNWDSARPKAVGKWDKTQMQGTVF